ncbi:hypothetical protein ATCVCanal1_471L [Acanthocystis turfacea Chlorella virus Canal-1]|nr:hypothetical protein ATCVCanal1_471L [Acanthocystis turfacea Chlorella virus Canal-1]
MAHYILAAVLALVVVLFVLWPRKEVYFSRDLAYDRANAILWTRYKDNATKGIKALDTEIKQTYKFPGFGDYTGMMCRGPNNYSCTAYNTLMY